MTSPAISPAHDAAHVREATDRLLSAVATLDGDAALAAPSRLPGWTRGHVLAHLARNADALVRALGRRPMYADEQARDAEIERDAGRPLAAHLDDLRESAARLDQAFAAQDHAGWDRELELRGGRSPAASLPFRRWGEIELHRVDLGAGYEITDLPGAFVERMLEHTVNRFVGHPGIERPVELRTEDGAARRIGPPDGHATVVVGAPAALVGWLTGRTRGGGLSGAGPLPQLPPL